MAERNVAVDRYLHYAPSAHRHAFAAIRALIHRIQPRVQEVVRYNMPLFDYHGLLCGFTSQPQGMCLYCRAEMIDRYRAQLGTLAVGRGCIRFQRLEEVPLEVLRAILIDSCVALDRASLQKSAEE